MIVKSITLPSDYARELQNLANEETDGNISAFIRRLLRKELLDYDVVPCMTCGKLLYIDDGEEASCGEYMCEECGKEAKCD